MSSAVHGDLWLNNCPLANVPLRCACDLCRRVVDVDAARASSQRSWTVRERGRAEENRTRRQRQGASRQESTNSDVREPPKDAQMSGNPWTVELGLIAKPRASDHKLSSNLHAHAEFDPPTGSSRRQLAERRGGAVLGGQCVRPLSASSFLSSRPPLLFPHAAPSCLSGGAAAVAADRAVRAAAWFRRACARDQRVHLVSSRRCNAGDVHTSWCTSRSDRCSRTEAKLNQKSG